MTDDDFTDDQDPGTLRNRFEAKLAEESAARSAAETKANKLERDNAFLQAGIFPDNRSKYFLSAYDGELTQDAIKQAAAEAGLLDQPGVPASELAAHDRVANASAGAGEGTRDFVSEIYASNNAEEVLRAFREGGGVVDTQ